MSNQAPELASPAFQKLTGYLYALEAVAALPHLGWQTCKALCRFELIQLGEPDLTQYEIVGMADYFADHATVQAIGGLS